MDSFLRYSTTLLATPAVSRKTCGSNAPLLPFFLSFFGFIFLSKLPLGGDLPRHSYTTKRISARLYGSEQRRVPRPAVGGCLGLASLFLPRGGCPRHGVCAWVLGSSSLCELCVSALSSAFF